MGEGEGEGDLRDYFTASKRIEGPKKKIRSRRGKRAFYV